jgi:phosphopentomutase
VQFQWGYFPQTIPAFPADFTQALIREAGLPGILGDQHASGMTIIEELGEAHLKTGKPICYTSADSVFQIAAHEEAFGLERLYDLCAIARRLCDPLAIGRVIARPFVGARAGLFARTAHRRDYAMPPPAGNLLERAARAGRAIVSVGKIGDIFAHRDTGRVLKGASNADHIDLALTALDEAPDGGLIFVNLVDFDTEFGHRRDVAGYAACLEAFDARLPELAAAMREEDFCVITADHGNDPTWRGYDHTREHVPILAFGRTVAPGPIGRRATLADIAETIAARLGLPRGAHGASWLS